MRYGSTIMNAPNSHVPEVGRGPDVPAMIPHLIPLQRIPALIPSARPGKRLAIATVYRWVQRGRLNTVKVGGGRFVTEAELVRLLSPVEGESGGGPAPGATESARRAGAELERLLGGDDRSSRPRHGTCPR